MGQGGGGYGAGRGGSNLPQTDVAMHHGKVLQCTVGKVPAPPLPAPPPPLNRQTENITFARSR